MREQATPAAALSPRTRPCTRRQDSSTVAGSRAAPRANAAAKLAAEPGARAAATAGATARGGRGPAPLSAQAASAGCRRRQVDRRRARRHRCSAPAARPAAGLPGRRAAAADRRAAPSAPPRRDPAPPSRTAGAAPASRVASSTARAQRSNSTGNNPGAGAARERARLLDLLGRGVDQIRDVGPRRRSPGRSPPDRAGTPGTTARARRGRRPRSAARAIRRSAVPGVAVQHRAGQLDEQPCDRRRRARRPSPRAVSVSGATYAIAWSSSDRRVAHRPGRLARDQADRVRRRRRSSPSSRMSSRCSTMPRRRASA